MASEMKRTAVRKINGAHFRGNAGMFLNGIPPRDLTAEEWSALDVDLKKSALDSGLYTVAYHDEKEID